MITVFGHILYLWALQNISTEWEPCKLGAVHKGSTQNLAIFLTFMTSYILCLLFTLFNFPGISLTKYRIITALFLNEQEWMIYSHILIDNKIIIKCHDMLRVSSRNLATEISLKGGGLKIF